MVSFHHQCIAGYPVPDFNIVIPAFYDFLKLLTTTFCLFVSLEDHSSFIAP